MSRRHHTSNRGRIRDWAKVGRQSARHGYMEFDKGCKHKGKPCGIRVKSKKQFV